MSLCMFPTQVTPMKTESDLKHFGYFNMSRVLNTDSYNSFHGNCVRRGLLNSHNPDFSNSSILFQILWHSGLQFHLGCTQPWPPAATWYGLSECGTPSCLRSPMQIIQKSSPSLQGPHQAPGPRPEGNAIAMETAPAPSVAPFSSPSPLALPGHAPACSSFSSPDESRARANEQASERPRVRTGHLP